MLCEAQQEECLPMLKPNRLLRLGALAAGAAPRTIAPVGIWLLLAPPLVGYTPEVAAGTRTQFSPIFFFSLYLAPL